MRWRAALATIGCTLVVIASAWSPSAARRSAASTWPPFVLVAGLLAIGALAQAAGLFDRAASVLGRGRHSSRALLVRLLTLVAVVTVVLNLDTAAAFLTPVVILAARRRRADERPFLYGTLLMTNAASLLLPGSNLTNLLVVAQTHQRATAFASHMFPAWLAAVLATGAVMTGVPRLRAGSHDTTGSVITEPIAESPMNGLGRFVAVVIGVAAVLVLLLGAPAAPVAILAVLATVSLAGRRQIRWRPVLDAVDPVVLGALFAIAVALGTVARSWDFPARTMAGLSAAGTVVVAAIATVLCNNLPATVLLSGTHVAHPTALLVGLDLGPNLAVTGSLSALVWFKAAASVGARPDWRQVTRIGLVVVPVSVAAVATALAVAAALS